MKNNHKTSEATQGVASVKRMKVEDVEKFIAGDLNYLNFFLGAKPKVSVKAFRDVLPEKGKGVDDEQIKRDMAHFSGTTSRFPLMIMTTPGLVRLMAEHVCGAHNNWLEAKAQRGEITIDESE